MEQELEIILETEEELNVTLETQEKLLDVDLETDTIEIIKTDAESYEGPYNITPLAFQEQEFETKDKILEENIKVKEIPYYETSNQYGDTVYIGGN